VNLNLTLPRRRSTDGEPVAGAPGLQVESIHAAYERVEVLRGVTLSIEPGQVFALLGPNGAGKSTTLRVISGRMRPRKGRVLVGGRDVTGQPAERLARAGVCSVPEGRGVFPNLTVAENLRMWTFRGGLRRGEVEEATYARFPNLAERRHQVAGTLSGGEQQMLSLSRAISTKPRLLLLDEISMGLAPIIVAQLYEIVGQIAREGYSILLVEQFAATALAVADRAAVMIHGEIEMEGTPAEVGQAVGELYLGTESKQPTNEETESQ
jgi:branched-chain amino acid transport system ATP-binding protein